MGRRAVRRRARGPRVVLNRLFVAVFPPPGELAALQRALPAGGRVSPIAKWHITLAFLGDVPSPDPIAALLGAVRPPGPFTLRLSGSGRFGAAEWIGVEGDRDQLTTLHTRIADGLAAGGHPIDDRPYHPHLTVSYHADSALRKALGNYVGAPWPVTEFSLVLSHNGRYEKLQSWPL
ncbi:RNA 2',3'-cyclic phosphodiesterase [Actinoplanes sp. NPDC049596]|uniref:RNA 2',3'-cyclic phosphodiesterase n=1 Tax=unclassified Actinoplanes TaxID=2626549 RepID=UPI00342662A0